jgi:hypothetical protein
LIAARRLVQVVQAPVRDDIVAMPVLLGEALSAPELREVRRRSAPHRLARRRPALFLARRRPSLFFAPIVALRVGERRPGGAHRQRDEG